MKNKIEDEIKAKMVIYESNRFLHLKPDEKKLVQAILKADKNMSILLKKQYPNLYFILELKKIESENT